MFNMVLCTDYLVSNYGGQSCHIKDCPSLKMDYHRNNKYKENKLKQTNLK